MNELMITAYIALGLMGICALSMIILQIIIFSRINK